MSKPRTTQDFMDLGRRVLRKQAKANPNIFPQYTAMKNAEAKLRKAKEEYEQRKYEWEHLLGYHDED